LEFKAESDAPITYIRLIPEEEQSAIWAALIEGLTNDPSIPFNIGPENFGTIDGYYEAYYAVLASNYIAGRIDGNLKRVPGTNMVGAMDMVSTLSSCLNLTDRIGSRAGRLHS
jgi:hypothetical protein